MATARHRCVFSRLPPRVSPRSTTLGLSSERAPDRWIFLADAPERNAVDAGVGRLAYEHREQLGVGYPDLPLAGLRSAQRIGLLVSRELNAGLSRAAHRLRESDVLGGCFRLERPAIAIDRKRGDDSRYAH